MQVQQAMQQGIQQSIMPRSTWCWKCVGKYKFYSLNLKTKTPRKSHK